MRVMRLIQNWAKNVDRVPEYDEDGGPKAPGITSLPRDA
jgi:hypothetical protein